jgi:hypothetical protein
MTATGQLWKPPAEKGTAGAYLRQRFEEETREERCLASLSEQALRHGFEVDPQIWVDRQMRPGSRLFAIGDSVIGQLHALGRPGLSCSGARPCEGSPPFQAGANASWEVELDKTDERYKGKGWQHLKRYMVRSSRGAASQVEGWEVSPAVQSGASGAAIEESVALLRDFLRLEARPSADDVMLIGLLGNHFNSDLAAFGRYAELLMRDVVTPFPGRVVVLGSSPQHFRSQTGAFDTSQRQTGCGPNPSPSDANGGNNKYRSYIWGYNVWQHMRNRRARFVDMYDLLHPLWRCHRNEQDCTHWTDAVISIQVQLVLEALQKIT